MIVNFVTSCGDRCGIASYSRNLLKASKPDIKIKKVCLPPFSFNPLNYLLAGISAGRGCDLVHVQYQQGLFGCILPLPVLRAINHFPLFSIPILLYRLFGKKVVYTIHENNPSNPWQLLALFLMNLTSDKLMVHSEDIMPILMQNGISKNKIEYLPLPILEREPLSKTWCRKNLGIKASSFVIVLFGFIHKNKGFDLVLSLLPKLPQSTELIIAGSARTAEHKSYLRTLKQTSRKLIIEDRVHFFDYLSDDELPELFHSADLAILPYRWIQTSAVLTDLLSCNLPILTSDLPHFQTIKKKYSCIETFKSNNPDDLLLKITYLMEHQEKLKELSASTKKFVSDSSASAVFSKTCEMYSQVLSD